MCHARVLCGSRWGIRSMCWSCCGFAAGSRGHRWPGRHLFCATEQNCTAQGLRRTCRCLSCTWQVASSPSVGPTTAAGSLPHPCVRSMCSASSRLLVAGGTCTRTSRCKHDSVIHALVSWSNTLAMGSQSMVALCGRSLAPSSSSVVMQTASGTTWLHCTRCTPLATLFSLSRFVNWRRLAVETDGGTVAIFDMTHPMAAPYHLSLGDVSTHSTWMAVWRL